MTCWRPHRQGQCPGLADPRALTVWGGSNMPTAVPSLNVKESKLGPRERGDGDKIMKLRQGRTWARVQKDFRCWFLRRRRLHPSSRKEKGSALGTHKANPQTPLTDSVEIWKRPLDPQGSWQGRGQRRQSVRSLKSKKKKKKKNQPQPTRASWRALGRATSKVRKDPGRCSGPDSQS